MGHRKASGSARNGRDSRAQRLGVKAYGGTTVLSGSIIVRQRGTKFVPGRNARIGRDHTIYAVATGTVMFDREGHRVNIVPQQENT